MQFEIQTACHPGVFHKVPIQGRGTYILLPTIALPPSDDLWVNNLEESKGIDSLFTVGLVGLGGYADSVQVASGFLFHSTLPTANYGTAVMTFSNAMRQSEKFRVDPEETTTVFRNSHFYVYTVKSVATLITCPEVSEDLNSFLTMI